MPSGGRAAVPRKRDEIVRVRHRIGLERLRALGHDLRDPIREVSPVAHRASQAVPPNVRKKSQSAMSASAGIADLSAQ